MCIPYLYTQNFQSIMDVDSQIREFAPLGTSWLNGRASDSRSEGWEFKSLRGYFFFIPSHLHGNVIGMAVKDVTIAYGIVTGLTVDRFFFLPSFPPELGLAVDRVCFFFALVLSRTDASCLQLHVHK